MGRFSRRLAMLAGAALLLAVAGCAPVYWFREQRALALPSSDLTAMRARLEAIVEAAGLHNIGASDGATGVIGCGQTAPDRTTFHKQWHDWSDHFVWVHEFTCEGNWQVVIVSSTSAETDARELRDALSKEFAAEIASGALLVETK